MGSGPKRKGNDVLRVNRPQKSTGQGTGNGNGSPGSPVDINQVCPQAFDERIKPKRPFPNGTSVTVEGKDLFVMDEKVGKLSEAHIKTITRCGGAGIHYIGRVWNKGTEAYARFTQG